MINCICQSCGMPMHHAEMFGTGVDGMPIEEYCIYCYKDGGFTSDVTMDEMIQLCTNYVSGNKRFYQASMRSLYPHLKRWAKKENTESEYYKSINNVLMYVNRNLHENADLKTLAGIANISPYHFHRIFKSVIGESLGEYVIRMRMEYVAEQLKNSAHSLGDLAQMTGYSSEQSLSRAFRNYFNIPPKTFKTLYFNQFFQGKLTPRICKVAEKKVFILRESSESKTNWQKLYLYGLMNRLISDKTESIEVIRDGQFIPALTIQQELPSDRFADHLLLSEGLFAIFTHRGQSTGIRDFYGAILNYWLPKSKYCRHTDIAYVIFLNNPAMTPHEELLAEVYLPIIARNEVGDF